MNAELSTTSPTLELSLLKELDEAPIMRYHWRTVVTTGLGFFTDAYDLFIIGTVTTVLQSEWHLSVMQISLINSTSLLSAALGALIFGFLMDHLGRRVMYGLEALMLTVGALLSAISPNFTFLMASRFLLGLGVGGDYPASAIIISEFANRQDRGRLVTSVFAMQGLGLVAGPLIGIFILHMGLPAGLGWRILLGLGALPALLVIYLRRTMTETPRFTLHVQGDVDRTAQIVNSLTGQNIEVTPVHGVKGKSNATFAQSPFFKRLIATSASWFLVDVAFYGNSISSHLILSDLFKNSALVETMTISLGLFVVFALPGYWVAAKTMDTLGRRSIQWIGFLVMAVGYAAIAAFPNIASFPYVFILLYGITYFFIEFGPNTTTFIYPSELFPTHLRGRGHGLAAAAGKLGAFVAALYFPFVLQKTGSSILFLILAGVSILGLLVTIRLLPEPKRRALEELNGTLASETVHRTYSRIMQSIHEEDIDKIIAEEMLAISGGELIVIHRLTEDNRTLQPIAWHGAAREHQEFADQLDFSVMTQQGEQLGNLQALFFSLCERMEIMVYNDLDSYGIKLATAAGLRSLVAFPLLEGNRCLGVLSIWDRDANQFLPEGVEKLRTFVQVISLALIHTRRFMDLRQLAYTDALTQLPNRMGFEQELEKRMDDFRINPDKYFAFVILDLDYFKQVNDTYGHQYGDKALQDVSYHLKQALGRNDVAARLGGDEFIILLDDVRDLSHASDRLQWIFHRIPFAQWKLGVSAGVSRFPDDGQTYQELYRVADARLYTAKNAGRGRIIIHGDHVIHTNV